MLLDRSAPLTGGLSPADREKVMSFLAAKCEWSRQNHDIFKAGDARAPVPIFASPAAAANYYGVLKGNPYTGDPLWGVVDFYTHPERLQAALDVGKVAIERLFIDCDDAAGWYAYAVRQMPGFQQQIVTIIDSRIVGSHVICLWRGHGKQGVLDTCGYHELPDLTEATICRTFTGIFASRGYQYIGACETLYPWM